VSRLIDTHRARAKAACLLIVKVAGLLVLAACNPIKVPAGDAVSSDPNRMRELMRQCKVEWAKVGDATCTKVSEAWRRRFFGNSDSASSAGPALQSGSEDAVR
jgi:hypothetical protein